MCVSVSVCRPRGSAACVFVVVVAVVVAVVSCFLIRSATTQFRLHFQVPERIFWPPILEMCQL